MSVRAAIHLRAPRTITLLSVASVAALLLTTACKPRQFNAAKTRSAAAGSQKTSLKPWDMHIPIAGTQEFLNLPDSAERVKKSIGIDTFLSPAARLGLTKHMTLQFPYVSKSANGTALDEKEEAARKTWKQTRKAFIDQGGMWHPRDVQAKRIAMRECMESEAPSPWKVAGVRFSPREIPFFGSVGFWSERFPGKSVNRLIHFRLSFDLYCEMDFDGRLVQETQDAGVHVTFVLLPDDPQQKDKLMKGAAAHTLLAAGQTEQAMKAASEAVDVMNSASYEAWYRATLAEWGAKLTDLRTSAADVKAEEYSALGKIYGALADTAAGKVPYPEDADFPFSEAYKTLGIDRDRAMETGFGVDPAFQVQRLTPARLDALKAFLQHFARKGTLASVSTFLAFDFESWHWGKFAIGALTDEEAAALVSQGDRAAAKEAFKEIKPMQISPVHLEMQGGTPRAIKTSNFGFYNSGNEIDVANPESETAKTAPARILDAGAFARADVWPSGARPHIYRGKTIDKPGALDTIVKSSDTRESHLTTMACVSCHVAATRSGAVRARVLGVGAGARLTLMNSFETRISYRNALETVEDAKALAE